MLPQDQRGQLFVISAPSGVGKTTIIRTILAQWPSLRFSVSCTTRSPRAGETPGKDYHFLSHEEFERGIQSGRFLEWAQVHGQYYGTDGEQIEEWLIDGEDVLLDIDVQGARQVRCAHPGVQSIFILPPSMKALEERLRGRNTESPEQLAARLTAARKEIQEAHWYDYIVVNDILEDAIADLQAILRSCRCKRMFQLEKVRTFLIPQTPF
ncbi:guanylate kinase [Desulforhabdus amnigena]|uniref:Guanylate kinase n=1 Tax=Desulforhabdus amnigena TaxID=40218 RepID=A0A9W6D2S4_9BACT|nr:guanylate kinase [Desulforhabdus amnigena]NLJ27833.1 guanylate kinase [Deltaproteobacteria bacterium]GLI34800.1 guanylate kinase [Desulforhabdus amnigena]